VVLSVPQAQKYKITIVALSMAEKAGPALSVMVLKLPSNKMIENKADGN
jgi:hypothetical protein